MLIIHKAGRGTGMQGRVRVVTRVHGTFRKIHSAPRVTPARERAHIHSGDEDCHPCAASGRFLFTPHAILRPIPMRCRAFHPAMPVDDWRLGDALPPSGALP